MRPVGHHSPRKRYEAQQRAGAQFRSTIAVIRGHYSNTVYAHIIAALPCFPLFDSSVDIEPRRRLNSGWRSRQGWHSGKLLWSKVRVHLTASRIWIGTTGDTCSFTHLLARPSVCAPASSCTFWRLPNPPSCASRHITCFAGIFVEHFLRRMASFVVPSYSTNGLEDEGTKTGCLEVGGDYQISRFTGLEPNCSFILHVSVCFSRSHARAFAACVERDSGQEYFNGAYCSGLCSYFLFRTAYRGKTALR